MHGETISCESPGKSLLKVSDLHVSFKNPEGIVAALRGVSFDVNRSETVGVVGESGCGKSVTAQAIMRILPPTARIDKGAIELYLDGNRPVRLHELDPYGPEIRRIRGRVISMIFQEPMLSLSPVHTVGNQIMEAIRLHIKCSPKEARDRAIEMLRYVGIRDAEKRIDAYSFQLSGGMRQRGMIAMALSCGSQMLIADEPTTALDVTIQAQILALIRRVQADTGMSVMLITHDLGIIGSMSDRVVVMYLGRIVETASADTVLTEPKHPYTRALLEAVPRFGHSYGIKLRAIRGSVPGPHAKLSGCAFHPRCPECIPGVCDTIQPANVLVSKEHWVACHLYYGDEGKSDVQQL